eukprot:CAMPEP_0119467710 /NCGR_PEP_ID=MMETSP1344-20130328/1775_1 /TAXON_ID=236787 /ORGANISM="Florenciella parvula, Strain CCMP2471" /LENGTH=70 /DNA_ID=CAMNT_0007500101 /DNA_START=405 /DNA_END=614 /DNA_ORIENTATION=-
MISGPILGLMMRSTTSIGGCAQSRSESTHSPDDTTSSLALGFTTSDDCPSSFAKHFSARRGDHRHCSPAR